MAVDTKTGSGAPLERITSGRPRTGARRLVVAGELDVSDARELRRGLRAVDPVPGVLAVDLGRRTFVATSGVAGRDTHLLLAGELDIATRPVLVAALRVSLRAEPASLVLDLRDLSFIDGRGAAILAATARRSAAWGGTLEVRGARPSIRRVFALCSFPDLVTSREPGTGTLGRAPGDRIPASRAGPPEPPHPLSAA